MSLPHIISRAVQTRTPQPHCLLSSKAPYPLMAVFVFQHNPLSYNDPFISVQAQSMSELQSCICVHKGR